MLILSKLLARHHHRPRHPRLHHAQTRRELRHLRLPRARYGDAASLLARALIRCLVHRRRLCRLLSWPALSSRSGRNDKATTAIPARRSDRIRSCVRWVRCSCASIRCGCDRTIGGSEGAAADHTGVAGRCCATLDYWNAEDQAR